MDEKYIHDLAVAYAQVKLQNYQETLKNQSDYHPFECDSEEVYLYAKAYRFALDNFENEFDKIG